MNDTPWKPVGYYVLIKLDKIETHSKGGLKLDNTYEAERKQRGQESGIVIDMGPEAYSEDKFPFGPYCKIGDRVWVKRYNGNYHEHNGNSYRIINDSDPYMVDKISEETENVRR